MHIIESAHLGTVRTLPYGVSILRFLLGVRVSGGDLCTKCRSTDRAGRQDCSPELVHTRKWCGFRLWGHNPMIAILMDSNFLFAGFSKCRSCPCFFSGVFSLVSVWKVLAQYLIQTVIQLSIGFVIQRRVLLHTTPSNRTKGVVEQFGTSDVPIPCRMNRLFISR